MAWADGDSPRRRYHVGNLRAELLQHARAILEESGLEALNLRALAARVGIAPGSVYHHYENKTALLAGLAVEGFGELQRQLEAATCEAPKGTRIRANARAYFAFARAQPALYALMSDPKILADPEVCAALEQAFAVLEGLAGLVFAANGAHTPDEVHKVALAVWACCHGTASITLASAGAHDDLIEDVIQGLDVLFRRV